MTESSRETVKEETGEEEQEQTRPATPPARPQRPLMRVLQALALTLVCLLLALLGWRLLGEDRSRTLIADIRDGKKPAAPAFDLPVIWDEIGTWPPPLRQAAADGRISPDELRGHPVVLNVWASWCVPCREEAPILAASARTHAGAVAFLGIDVQDFVSDARRFLTRFKVNYVSVRDGSSDIYDNYGLRGIPETYYLDAHGRILAHTLGAVTPETLEAGIAQAIESGNS
jgi:cytochrome c biogenesis protein CcmG, thiol:disulfide interchange protein DsbE